MMSGPAITIRQAAADDIAAMNYLMQASRAYQGEYRSILDGYQLTSAQIERDHVYVAEEHAKVLCFYSLIARSPDPELDLLFVSDAAQGFGIGSDLIAHLKDFYLRMGAKIIGTSAAHGRVTWERPVLTLLVTSEAT